MNFQTVEYVNWFRENWYSLEYDLATSGMPPVTQKELNILMEDLDLGKTLFYGDPGLVELISENYGIEKNEILITSGATHANFLVCALMVSEGDEVVVEHPVYTPLLDVVKTFGGRIKLLHRKFEEGYKLNVERLKDLVGNNTRMIVLTNLHNPSGMIMDNETLRAVGEIAHDSGTYVLSDEVYKDFVLKDIPSTFSSLNEFGISTHSLTKFYGTGALRIGWMTCEPELVEKARKLNDYLLVTNSCASERLAALILEKRKWFVDRVNRITSRNYPIVERWMEERNDLEWIAPEYGVIGFPKLLSHVDSMELAELLLRRYRTLISPGGFFGAENHIRIGFAGQEEKLKKGLEYLGLALDELSSSVHS